MLFNPNRALFVSSASSVGMVSAVGALPGRSNMATGNPRSQCEEIKSISNINIYIYV